MKQPIYRLNDVMRRTGVSRSTIYKWTKAGTFPPPTRLGARLLVWSEAEIEAWLKSRLSNQTEKAQ